VNQALTIVKENEKIEIILPFLVHYIYNHQNFQILNGYRKKMLFLRLIYALMNNKFVDLEY